MRKLTLFCILIFCLFPRGVFADEAPTMSVVINEIAWMGTPSDDNDEWIELYNTTNEDIDLNGWSLKSADGIPSIEFTNGEVIKANDYFLLERTDDTAVSVKANKIYTGALSNSNPAEYLILRNSEGVLIDEVNASGGWFAGSNTPNPRISMERINPNVSGSEASNWGNNNGIITNGLDKNNISLSATPLAQNSIYEEGDITSPVTTAFLDGNLYSPPPTPTFDESKTLTFTVNETATIYYAFGENPSEEDFIAYADEEILIEATKVVNFYAVDLVGNKEIIQTLTITINITYDTAEAGEILINEVAWMGSDNSAWDEWVELRNLTDKTFNLDDWKIIDELNSDWEIVLSGKLLPNDYFLLERKDDASPANADLVYPAAIRITNDVDAIFVLQDSASTEIDRVDASNDWEIGGNPDTKQTLARVDRNTFRSSKEVNGSPKAQNFYDNDLAITSLTASSPNPLPGEDVIFTATIENTGLNLQTSFTLHWLVGGEETYPPEEISESLEKFTTFTPETFTHAFTESETDYVVSAVVELTGDNFPDEDNSNSFREISLSVENHLLINEFVPNPEGDDAVNEWIEIYNPTDSTIDLNNWNLNGVNLTGEILAGEYKVVTAGEVSGWNSLTSTTDSVILKNAGVVVDSHSYSNAAEKKSFGRNAANLSEWLEFFHPTHGSANLTPEANTPPVAKITIQGSGSTSGKCNLFVNLTAEDSTDSDGDSLTYYWEGGSFEDSSEENPAGFYFQAVGNYTVSLTVTDSLGESSTDSKDFSVMGCGGGGIPTATVTTKKIPDEISIPSILASAVVLKITEISMDAENDWVEIQMLDDGKNGGGVEIGGFYFEDDKNIKTIPRGVTLKTGEFLLLTFDSENPDAKAIEEKVWKLYSPRSGITKTDEEMILKDSLGNIEDAVVWENRNESWSKGEDADVEALVAAQAWNSAETSAAVDSSMMFRDMILARFPDNRDTDSVSDWFTTIFPTPGAKNGNPPTHAKDFHFRFSSVEFKNPSGDKIQIECKDCAKPVDLTGFFLNTGLRENILAIPVGMQISATNPIEIIFGAKEDSVSENTIYSTFPGLISSDGLLSFKDFENTTADFVGWSDRKIPKLRDYDLSMAEFTQLQKRVREGEWDLEDSTSLLDSTQVKRGGKIQRKASSDTDTAADWEVVNLAKDLETIEVSDSRNVYFSEILPNPIGKDDAAEWFELHNAGNSPVELYGWSVMVGKGVYEFENSIILQPKEFRAFFGLLPILNSGSDFTLVNFEGEVVDSITYPTIPEGKAYAKSLSGWKITSIPTPDAANGFFQILSEKEDADSDGLSNADEAAAGSDAELFDTDGDGLSDAFEVNRGLNPNLSDASPEDLRAYQQELAALTASELTAQFDETNGVFLAGIGIPGGVMRLYLQSELQILEIPIDADGNWSYTLDTSLEAGNHNIFTQLITPSGVTAVAKKVLNFTLAKDFTPPVFASQIRISEILPNPKMEDSKSEWVEIQNDGNSLADISGYQLTAGKKNYEFPAASTIPAGGFLLLPRNLTQ
ncbi:MAG: lamin tail domain-containing protein, partial [Candidatus Gracilibacteria bacterium]|nr:lamin tail domain-containing protein [Candidatus Gracilibacteria bacterium]